MEFGFSVQEAWITDEIERDGQCNANGRRFPRGSRSHKLIAL